MNASQCQGGLTSNIYIIFVFKVKILITFVFWGILEVWWSFLGSVCVCGKLSALFLNTACFHT